MDVDFALALIDDASVRELSGRGGEDGRASESELVYELIEGRCCCMLQASKQASNQYTREVCSCIRSMRSPGGDNNSMVAVLEAVACVSPNSTFEPSG